MKSKFRKIRLSILITLLISIATYFFLLPYTFYYFYQPQQGDIIFQSLPKMSELVEAIEGVSESPFSHCGVVVKRGEQWKVNEAIGNVHDTNLLEFILRGRGGHFSVYRLKNDHVKKIDTFVSELKKYQGKPYDFKYSLGDDYIYCSELVYKAFNDATKQKLGKLYKLGDLNWKPYEETIKKFEGGPPPLERLMITPKHLSQAEQLYNVYSFGY